MRGCVYPIILKGPLALINDIFKAIYNKIYCLKNISKGRFLSREALEICHFLENI